MSIRATRLSPGIPFLVAPLCIALAACGGSGSSSSSGGERSTSTDGQQTETVERVSLTGLAVKGVVHGAKAELFRIVDGAVETSAFAKGVTNQQGRYELTVVSNEAFDGPALVKVSWQEGAEMTCDASLGCGAYSGMDGRDTNASGTIDFGERFDLDSDFQMAALIPRLTTDSGSDRLVTAHISSLTHMAATLAQRNVISETSADAANNQIRAVLGLADDVDIVLTPPLNVTGNSDESGNAEYGAITAAIANIANARGISIAQVLTEVAGDFLDNEGQLLWNDKGELTEISIKEIIASALNIAQLLGNADLSERFQALIDLANTKDPDTPSDVAPPVADAGSNQAVSTSTTVTLNGSSNTDSTFHWEQISGTPVSLSNADAQQTTFTASPLSDDLVFRLTVTSQTTGYSDSDYVTVTATAAIASTDTISDLMGNAYTLWSPVLFMTSERTPVPSAQIGYGLEIEQDLSLSDDQASDDHPLNLITSGDTKLWTLENTYTANQFFTDSIARSDSSADLQGTVHIENSETMPADIDANTTLIVHAPSTSESSNTEHTIDAASSVDLLPIEPGTWFGSHINQADVFTLDDSGNPTDNQIRSEYSLINPLIVNHADDFSENELAEQYGVVALILGSDTSLGQLLSSELQSWHQESSVSGVATVTANSLNDTNSLGHRVARYTHQISYNEDSAPAFSVATSPYTLDLSSDAPQRENAEINFSVRNNGQLRVPSTLLDTLFDSEQVALEGMASSTGQLVMAQLMGSLNLGEFHGTNIEGVAYERYLALATSPTTATVADLQNALFQIKGTLFNLDSNTQGISAAAISGSLSFGDNTVALALNTDESELQNAGFTTNRIATRTTQTAVALDASFASNGYITFTLGGMTFEGYINDKRDLMALRVLDQNALSDHANQATHGFVIAHRIDD